MFDPDEFGNPRILPLAFALAVSVLGLAAVATSQTLWANTTLGARIAGL